MLYILLFCLSGKGDVFHIVRFYKMLRENKAHTLAKKCQWVRVCVCVCVSSAFWLNAKSIGKQFPIFKELSPPYSRVLY